MATISDFLETMNSVFIKTDGNNSFSITTEGHWSSEGGAETFQKLHKLSQLRSRNDNKLHVEEVRKEGNQT